MEVIDAQMFKSICNFHNFSFVFSPSVGVAGDILLIWYILFFGKKWMSCRLLLDEFVGVSQRC